MNLRLITILICSVSLPAFAQEHQYSLKECIEIAFKNSNIIKQSELQVNAAGINYRQSKLNLLPSLNVNINHGINQGRSIDPFTNNFINQTINFAGYNLNSSVILFNGFSMQNTIKQFNYTHEAAEMDLQQLKDNLSLNIVLAYMQVLSSEDILEQAKQQKLISQRQVERLEVLNREGAISPPQLYDLRGQAGENELTVISAANILEQSKLLLSQLMNIAYDPAMHVERIPLDEFLSPPPVNPTEIYQAAVKTMSGIEAARFRTLAAGAGLKAIRGQILPALFFNGNLNSNYSSAAMRDVFIQTTEVPTSDYVLINGNKIPVIAKQSVYDRQQIEYNMQLKNNLFSTIAIGIRVPLFNSFQTRNNIKLADILLKAQELNEQETKRQLRQEVEQAYLDMQNAYERYKVILEQVSAYAESFRAAEVRFNAGVGTSIDYLIAKSNLDRSRLNLINVQYEYMLRKKIIDFYRGERW